MSTWTLEKIDRLRDLAAQGLSAKQICAEFADGTSRSAIIAKCLRVGIQLLGKRWIPSDTDQAKKKIRVNGWSPEEDAIALRLWLLGKTDTFIAKEMGGKRTPHAVSDRLRRIGAKNGEMPWQSNGTTVAESAGLNPIFVGAEFSTTAEAVMALRRRSCRWPLGEPGEPGFRFCCAETVEGKSYCAVHGRIAAGKGAACERKAVRDAMRFVCA